MMGRNRGRATRLRPVNPGASAGLLVIGLLVLASCGGSKAPTATSTATPTPAVTGQPSSSPASPAPAPTGPGSVARCDLPGLAMAFKSQDAASGGLRVDTFVMTNMSQTACTLYGYVGMQMLGPTGNPMPTNVVRNGPNVSAVDSRPALVTLQPGGKASFLAAWRAWFDGGKTCPVASRLQITPPDAYDHVTLPVTWGLAPCNSGEIDVTAVAPGTGS